MIYLFVGLKLPLIAACWLVWYAIRAEPEAAADEPRDDGGSKRRPHPREPRPRGPRRGPHAGPAPQAPPRSRAPKPARARHLPR